MSCFLRWPKLALYRPKPGSGIPLHGFELLHNEREFAYNASVTRKIQDFSGGSNDRWLIWEFDYRPIGGVTISRFERVQVVFLDDYSLLEGQRVSIEMEYLMQDNALVGNLD